MKKRITVSKTLTPTPSFNLSALKPEVDVVISGRSEESRLMYDKLAELEVGQSYKMPINYLRIYTNAKVAHKRATGRIFIMRVLDKYSFRTWRLKDGTVLKTARKKRQS